MYMCVPNFMAIRIVVAKTFHKKGNLMVVLGEMSGVHKSHWDLVIRITALCGAKSYGSVAF